MGTQQPKAELNIEREVIGTVPWSPQRQIAVIRKQVRGEGALGTLLLDVAEIADFVQTAPNEGGGDSVAITQGVDIPLRALGDLIALLQTLHEQAGESA